MVSVVLGLPVALSLLVRVPAPPAAPVVAPSQGPLAGLGRVMVTSCDPRTLLRVQDSGRVTPTPRYDCPRALIFDRTGITYVTDERFVRLLGPDGSVLGLDGAAASSPLPKRRDALALRDLLTGPDAVGVGVDGTLFVRDTSNRRVRLLTQGGRFVRALGGGSLVTPRTLGDTPSRPVDVAVDAVGGLYVADPAGNRVRKVRADVVVSNWAGTGQPTSSGDLGPAARAGLLRPRGITIDRSGRVFVTEGRRLRRIDRDGTISTIAGTGGSGPVGDGEPAVLASLAQPSQVALDGRGNIYVFDPASDAVRRIAPDGIISTVGR